MMDGWEWVEWKKSKPKRYEMMKWRRFSKVGLDVLDEILCLFAGVILTICGLFLLSIAYGVVHVGGFVCVAFGLSILYSERNR